MAMNLAEQIGTEWWWGCEQPERPPERGKTSFHHPTEAGKCRGCERALEVLSQMHPDHIMSSGYTIHEALERVRGSSIFKEEDRLWR